MFVFDIHHNLQNRAVIKDDATRQARSTCFHIDSGTHSTSFLWKTHWSSTATDSIWPWGQRNLHIQHSGRPPRLTQISLMPSFSLAQYNLPWKNGSLDCAALNGVQQCTAFCCKYYCESTALTIPESEGTNRKTNCQAGSAECVLNFQVLWCHLEQKLKPEHLIPTLHEVTSIHDLRKKGASFDASKTQRLVYVSAWELANKLRRSEGISPEETFFTDWTSEILFDLIPMEPVFSMKIVDLRNIHISLCLSL